MKVERLIIDKFRHLEKIELLFGNRITAIAGQNATGKSSILGLVGHIFTFDAVHKTLNGGPFTTQCSEIFKFSYPKYDKPKHHNYSVLLDNGDSVPVLSYDRQEEGKMKALRVRVGKSAKGEGKRNLPVIYLGLRRLFPLAQEDKISQALGQLTAEEIKEYQDLHNEILIMEEEITPEYIEAFSKSFYAAKTKNYDCWGNSAGQDNVGQILTAILSFARLKNQLGTNYPGGILLIDEIDATMYPGAQLKLVEKLFRFAQDLDLQIIFTTHSTDVVEKILDPKYQADSKVIFLSKDTGKVKNVQEQLGIEEIINNLKVLLPLRTKTEKILVFCEDDQARLWIQNLLGNSITKNLKFVPDTFGAEELVTIANKKIAVFKRTIFVLDGDKSQALRRNKCPRVILLPGRERPENIFYRFLKGLPPGDTFWSGTGNYTKQVCFKDLLNISQDRTIMKEWFTIQKPCWGHGCSKLFNRWKQDNNAATISFREDFTLILRELTN
jgi:predicted ATPase